MFYSFGPWLLLLLLLLMTMGAGLGLLLMITTTPDLPVFTFLIVSVFGGPGENIIKKLFVADGEDK